VKRSVGAKAADVTLSKGVSRDARRVAAHLPWSRHTERFLEIEDRPPKPSAAQGYDPDSAGTTPVRPGFGSGFGRRDARRILRPLEGSDAHGEWLV